MLVSLVNAQRVGKERVAIPHSKFSESLLRVFQDKGLISSFRVQDGPQPKLIITLAYSAGAPVMQGARRISKPGRREYQASSTIPYSNHGGGFFIISTSSGLYDDMTARKEGLGGEIVCEVW